MKEQGRHETLQTSCKTNVEGTPAIGYIQQAHASDQLTCTQVTGPVWPLSTPTEPLTRWSHVLKVRSLEQLTAANGPILRMDCRAGRRTAQLCLLSECGFKRGRDQEGTTEKRVES